MKNFIKDESGLSYGLIITAVVIILFTTLMIEITPFLNIIANLFNDHIALGEVSVQAADAFQFTFEIRSFVMIAFIIGAILWLFIRALEHRENLQ